MANRNKAAEMIEREARPNVKIALMEMWLLFECDVSERRILVEILGEFKAFLNPPENDPDVAKAIAWSLHTMPLSDEVLALSLARSEESAAEEGHHLGGGHSDEALALSLARSEESAVEEGFHLRGSAGSSLRAGGGHSDEALALSLARSEESAVEEGFRAGGASLTEDADFDQRLFENLTVFDRRFQERSDVAKAAERRAQLNAALPGKDRAKLEKKLDGKR
jgi:hypothetical protein